VEHLTTDELRRIQRTLRTRYRIGTRSNLLDVGFGAALKAGKFQPGRRLCITFLVRKKKNVRKVTDRIPPKVHVRLKRGKRFVNLSFSTDVVEVGGIVAAGRTLDYRTKTVTTGVIVAWKASSRSRYSWGVVTVGHVFPRLRTLSRLRRKVTIRTNRGKFFGTLVAKSDGDREIDAAIAQVKRQDLVAKRLMTASQSARRIEPRMVTTLASDQNKSGQTLRVGGKRRFTVHAYFPSLRVPSLGAIDHIVSVFSGAAQTFQPGTSGSGWLIQNQAACLQIAGRMPDFKQGFGQSLNSVAEWAAKVLAKQQRMHLGSFRIVATF